MGFNTTIMFSNDAYDQFKKYPKETVNNILEGMNDNKKHHYGVGNHANPMKIMKTRHADDDMIYVYSGNTVCEMHMWSEETKNLMKNHPDYFKRMLNHMNDQVKQLKKKFKEIKNEKENN